MQGVANGLESEQNFLAGWAAWKPKAVMKTSGIIASLVLGALALSITVWIGRYEGSTKVLVPDSAPKAPVDPGPPISEAGPHPKAVTETTEYNFGKMGVHQKGSHKFTIKNDGPVELKLVAGESTCQCTLGELADGDTVPPGESRDVTLSWHIKAMVETFRHSAKIRTNDPDNRVIELVVTGKVDQIYQLSPGQYWEVGELSRTEPTKFTGQVFSTVDDAFEFKSLTFDDKKMKVTYEAMTSEDLAQKEAKSGYNVLVEVLPGVPIGPFAESLALKTDDEGEGAIQVKVNGRMTGPIEILGPAYRAETNQISFSEFPAAEGKEVTLSLFVRNFEGELQLLSVEPASDRVQFELKKKEQLAGTTQRYQLKVRVLPGAPIDMLRGPAMKLNLKFNHPESENMAIDVRMLAI